MIPAALAVAVAGPPIETEPWLTLEPQGELSSFGDDPAMGDFDADGYADLAITSRTYTADEGRVHLFSGGLTGFPTEPSRNFESPDHMRAEALALGDFDGDGADTLVLGTEVNAYLIDSATSSWTDLETWYIRNVLAADVNGDGLDDLMLAGHVGEVGSFDVFLGPDVGVGALPSAELGYCGYDSSCFSAVVGDVNGDGYLEVVKAWVSDNVNVFFGGAVGLQAGEVVTVRRDVVDGDTLAHEASAAGDVPPSSAGAASTVD